MEPQFKLDRPKVSDEEINRHKDFDNLVKQFKEQSIEKARSDVNFLKNKKATYSTVIAGAVVLCTVTYFTIFKKQATTHPHDKIATTAHTDPKPATKTTAAFISPPAPKLAVPYTSYKVNAAKGGEIRHSTHSKIKVPAKAFVDKRGTGIVGDVEIRYREFHNQAEIIASGIPMVYDSAGTQYHFESAGMFDIRGYQDGEPVFIKPGHSITVEMASGHNGQHFNQYLLDTVARNWTYIQKDKPLAPQAGPSENITAGNPEIINGPPANKTPAITALEKKISAIPPKIDSVKVVYNQKINQLPAAAKPTRPAKASERPQFRLEVNYKEFPELAAFKNAVFEIGEENKNYSKSLTQVTWSSARIAEGPQKGKNYLLTLTLGNRVEKLVVYPVLSGTDYETAISQYDKKLADYNTLLAKRVADEKKLQEEMARKQQAYLEEQKKLEAALLREQVRIRQEVEKQLAEQFNTMGNQQRVMRVFQVSHFGICNSDCPNSLPKGASVQPVFIAKGSANALSPNTVYMVEHGRNIVYNLAPEAFSKMSYDPTKDYSLCVLANGMMYLCSKEAFKAVTVASGHRFELSPLPEGVTDVADFKQALGI